MISLACLDMAGTTVRDDGLVLAAFQRALDELRVQDHDERDRMVDHVVATMGESKITVFRALMPTEMAAQAGNAAFEQAYAQLAEKTEPLPGAAETIHALREAGIKVVLTTGFSRTTADAILTHLGWQHAIDLSLCPSDVGGRGRPYPNMILQAVLRMQIADVREVLVVGDTASDIRSGLAAGAGLVAGVLTGAHDRARLQAAGAHHVLDGVADIVALVQPISRNAKG